MVQPPGFIDKDRPSHVCKLCKAIYGLKQVSRAWYLELHQFLISQGFKNSLADASLFILTTSDINIYLLVYVDDIIVTGSHTSHIQQFLQVLAACFSLKDLGSFSYFWGSMSFSILTVFFYLSRSILLISSHALICIQLNRSLLHYLLIILKLFFMELTSIASEYQTIMESLQYLTITRLDIVYVVNQLSQHMHRPHSFHSLAAKYLLCYLCGTTDHGIILHRSSPLFLHVFSDVDWAGDKCDFTSTSAYIVYLGSSPILWSSKK